MMGNLAYKVRQTQEQQPNQTPKIRPARRQKFRFTLGEKLLGILFSVAVIFCAIHIISTQVSIYKTNIEIQQIESSRSEEHTSELQSRENLVCRLLLEKK